MDQDKEEQNDGDNGERKMQLAIPCPNEEVVKVFSNHLIWYEIGKYLSYDDLKECRAVCRVFNDRVMMATNFVSRGYMDVTRFAGGNILEIPKFTSWKNLKVDAAKLAPLIRTHFTRRVNKTGEVELVKPTLGGCFLLGNVEPEWNGLKKIIEEAEALKLYSSQKRSINRKLNAELLLAAKSLKTLILDPSLIQLGVEKGEERISLPSKLEEIEFTAPAATLTEDQSEMVAKNLKKIAGLAGEMKLSSVKSCKLLQDIPTFPPELEEQRQTRLICASALVSLIQLQTWNLERLEINDPVFWYTTSEIDNSSVLSQAFPALKSITAVVDDGLGPSARNFVKFVRSNDSLEVINLRLIHKFPFDLFNALGRENAKKLKKLGLHLESTRSPEEVRWISLFDTELEEFELSMEAVVERPGFCPLRDLSLDSIFRNLPGTVKKVRVKGKSCRAPFAPLNLRFPQISSTNLTALELSNCGVIVTDTVVQFICQNFLSLSELNLAKAINCTDDGFLGGSGGANASIRNLKDLKYLDLKSCGKITDKTLINGVQYLRLKFLDVSENPKVTAKGCRAVLCGSPGAVIIGPKEEEVSEVPKHHSATAGQLPALTSRATTSVVSPRVVSGTPKVDCEVAGHKNEVILRAAAAARRKRGLCSQQ